MEKNKTKKPFFKRWWFVLIVVIIFLGALGSSGNNDDGSDNSNSITSTENSSTSSKPTDEDKNNEKKEENKLEDTDKIKAGMYKVGTEIVAGEYIVFNDGIGYIEATKDSSGSLESIIFNDNILGHTIITVSDGQYLKLQGAIMYPVDKAPSIIPEDGVYKDGMYKVGTHIQAGEYKVVPNGGLSYVEVSKDSLHQLESIVTNEATDSEVYITITDGQYLKLQGATINTK